jgi:Rieske 2Fe-2S family protein
LAVAETIPPALSPSLELHDSWLRYDAPLRDKPSDNRLERIYQRMVEPMPHLTEDDRRVWHYIFIYPNTAIDLYPDPAGIWRIAPGGPLRSADFALTLLPRDASLPTRGVQLLNRKLNQLVSHEDAELVANQHGGLETRGFEPGPLSRREAALGWFADKIRADLGEAA